MKHSLGKLVVLFSFVLLQAQDFTHYLSVDNTQPYVKEPIILSVELKQSNPNIVLMFNFDLAKSKDYSFQRLDTQETDIHPTQGLHNTKVKYTYLVYPLVSGEVSLHFKLLQKVTTDESVAYSFSGDRDNVKGLVTTDTIITLPPLSLQVKPLPKNTQIVGDFSLDYSIKKHKANAYEPLPFQVTLKGLGHPPLLKLIPKDVNFTLFLEKPLVTSVASLQGIHSTIHYPMALSHSKSFTLDSINLKAFNPKTEKAYELTVPKQIFNITQVSKASLVDKTDKPKVLKDDWSWITSAFIYFTVFSAGYLTALSFKWTKKVQTKENNPLKNKIQNANDTKMLLQVLLAHNSHRFSTIIQTLENSLYADGKINLNKVKKEAMDII